MGGNTVFAILSVSVLIALGLGAALTQFGLMIYVFGKWGFVQQTNVTGTPVLYFLSDMFVLNPGLAYAWAFSIIPSVAIAATIIITSIARDLVIWNYIIDTYKPPYNMTRFVWFVTICAQWGLALLSYFDLHHPSGMHYVGVALFGMAGVILNFWVLYLDYGIERASWHPVYTFDGLLTLISFIALIMFVFGTKSISAASEWVVLLLMVTLHALLPFRGTRVVLSRPQIWYNSWRSPVNGKPDVRTPSPDENNGADI